jgi:hypothetical protein
MSRSDPASPPQLPRAASKRTNLVRFELTSLLLEADYHESWGFHKAVVERFANMRIDAKALRAMGVVQVRLWWACCGLESTALVGAAAGPSQQRIRHPMEEEEEESTAPALGRLREEALLLFGGKTGSAVKRRQSMFESYKTEAASLALMAAELVDSVPEAQWSQTQGPGGSNKCNHSIELLKQARAACGHFFGPRNHLAELFDQANEELCAFLRVQSSECIRGPRALPLATTRFGEPTTTCSLSGINMLTRGGPSGANYHPPHDPDDRELQEALAQSLKMDRDRELEEAELQEAVALSLNMVVPANMTSALSNYEIFHQLKPGLVTREQVAASSAGINGWAIMNPQTARHEAEEDGCPSPCEAWDGWMVLDEDKEVASEDELQDRCPVQPCGDKEEEQSLQRALLASLGVVTFSVLDDDHDDHDHDHRAMQALQEAYERLAIEAKVKEAIQADNTNAAVKALMAVAKEHQLQCAAPPCRAACLHAPPPPPSRSARPVPAHKLTSAPTTLCVHPRPKRPAACSALSSTSPLAMTRTLRT